MGREAAGGCSPPFFHPGETLPDSLCSVTVAGACQLEKKTHVRALAAEFLAPRRLLLLVELLRLFWRRRQREQNA
jgi:hypothetical protein